MLMGLTLLVALILSFWAISKKNTAAALGILIMSTLVWPEYYRIPLGIQLSVPRIIAIFLFLKFMFSSGARIRKNAIDYCVIFIWVWTILATIFAGSESKHTIEMIGRGFDTVMMYFVARKCISQPADVKHIYPFVAITAILMCGMGIYENITWHSPYYKFYFNLGFESRASGYNEIRYGLLRAQGSTTVSIYFGMAMMMIAVFIWSMRQYAIKPSRTFFIYIVAIIGAFTSLSSGPLMGVMVFVFFTLYFKKLSWIKPSVYLLILACIFMEIASNRHFYNLIDYLALDKQTAWYRTRLIEIAVMQWRDYWIVGTGSNFPHHWAALLDQRQHIDVVNNFIIVAIYGGLPSLIAFMAAHYKTIKISVSKFKRTTDLKIRKLIFGLTAGLIALDVGSFSVGIYGAVLILSYILLGMLVTLSSINDSTENESQLYE